MRSLKRTIVFKVNRKAPDKSIISYSAKALRKGALVAFPTETVYGLAANLLDKMAIIRLCKVKRRPKGKPFTVHIQNLNMIKKMGCAVTKKAKALIEKFWPGPLTIVLGSKEGGKIGFRMPKDKVALALIEKTGVPIVAPSANVSGKPPPRSAEEVLRQLDGKIDLLLDSGHTRIGRESTVIDLTATPPKILREGAISRISLFTVIGDE